MSDTVLDLIDNTLVAHGDAMRWSPDASAGIRQPGVRLDRVPAPWAPSAPGERVPYPQLDQVEREAIHAWVEHHKLALDRVPLDGILDFDPATREWRIRVYLLRDGRKYLAEDGTVATAILRRRELTPLYWRCAE